MTDEVVVLNNKTGAKEIVKLGYTLPAYDIGQRVEYKLPNGVTKEAEVAGLDMNVVIDDHGEVVTNVIYDMDNGDQVVEEDIESYYDKEVEEDEDSDAFKVGDTVEYSVTGVTGVSKIVADLGNGLYKLANDRTVRDIDLLAIDSPFKYEVGNRVRFFDGADLVETTIVSRRVDGAVNNYLIGAGYWVEEIDIVEKL